MVHALLTSKKEENFGSSERQLETIFKVIYEIPQQNF